MKSSALLLAILFSVRTIAQDSTEVSEPEKPGVQHEIAANTTLLLKQVFNLSNSTLPTLPYNITYKLIVNDCAFRFGAGFSMNTLRVEETETTFTSGSSNPTFPSPDQKVPTESESRNMFYRFGMEYRKMVSAKIAAYAGFDLISQYSKSHSQSSSEFNNLPFNYSYSRTTNDVTLFTYGGGPVAGIQFYPTKRLGIFTEMPIYYTRGNQKDVSENYTNVGNGFSGTMIYTSTTNKQTEESTLSGLSIILPVTIYLSFMF